MVCQSACGGCANANANANGNGNGNGNGCSDRLVDMEDYEAELTRVRARAKELEETMAKMRNGFAAKPPSKLRSSNWFNRKEDLAMSALYVERYLNSGLTREELMSGKPIIGIAQSGSDIAPVSEKNPS